MHTSRRRRPSLESLEDRGLLSAAGLTWPDPSHLTLSFVPDGTPVAGAPSALHQSLGANLASSAWKATILRAYQTWASLANINLGLVNDSGLPLGAPGPIQGAPDRGDLRVAARPLGANTLALGTSFDLHDSWAGDIVLDSSTRFGDGAQGTEGLFAAALHEAGHALGLEDNPSDPTSAMYIHNQPDRRGPNAADVAALRALYAPRDTSPDGNDASARADRLTFLATTPTAETLANPTRSASLVAPGEIASIADRDFYSVTVPADQSGPFVVTVRASGISLLQPKLVVFDALGQVVGSSEANSPLSNDVTVTIPSTLPGAVFRARVEAAKADVFGVGSYRVAAGLENAATVAASPPPVSSTGLADDGGRNDTPARATSLERIGMVDPSSQGWAYSLRAGIAHAGDVDYYRLETDKATAPYMIVTVWGLETDGLAPRVSVLDKKGNSVPSQLIERGEHAMTLQVPRTESNQRYLVSVSGGDSSSNGATGGYLLGVAFRPTPLPFQPFVSGGLEARKSEEFHTLTVNTAAVFRLDLGAIGPADTAVRATLYDASKRIVTSIRSDSGGTHGATTILLTPGAYTLRVVAGSRNGAPIGLVRYDLSGLVRSDPIGPTLIDTGILPVLPVNPQPQTDEYVWTEYDYLYYMTFVLPDLGGSAY